MLCHWYSITKNPTTLSDILNETLWLKKHIIFGGLSVLYQELYQKNITKLKDIISNNGQLMTAAELKINMVLMSTF